MKIYNFEQGTEEWFKIRKGKITASHAQAIGNNGKGLETYLNNLMAEYFSSGEKENYSNKHIERGIELEPIAKDIYELETGNKVENVGFIEYNEFVGCSPDGLIGKDGGIEIKSIDDNGYFKILMEGEKEIDSAYIWQIQMSLLITGRKWWDFVAYNPNYKKSIYICRIYPDKNKFEKLLKGFEIAKEKIKLIIEKYNKLI